MRNAGYFGLSSTTTHIQTTRIVLALSICFVAAIVGSGCPTALPIVDDSQKDVDLAVGDVGGTGQDYAQVLLYDDVLSKGNLQDPDVVISGQDFDFLKYPYSIQLTGDHTGNDLYVSDVLTNLVAVWRDYRDLGQKAAADRGPSVVLFGMCKPVQILHVDDRLYVCNKFGVCDISHPNGSGGGYIAIYDHIGAVTAGHGDTPSLVISDILHPSTIAVANDILYVGVDTQNPPYFPSEVNVYDHITERIDGTFPGDPNIPSVVIGGSSFSFHEVAFIENVSVFGGRLYVGLNGFSDLNRGIYVFDHADDLVDQQAPVAFLGSLIDLVGTGQMRLVGDTFYTGFDGRSIPSSKKSDLAVSSALGSTTRAMVGAKIDSIDTYDKKVVFFENSFYGTMFAGEGNTLFACVDTSVLLNWYWLISSTSARNKACMSSQII